MSHDRGRPCVAAHVGGRMSPCHIECALLFVPCMRKAWSLWILLPALGAGCAAKDYVQLYKDRPRAPSYSKDDIASMRYMGATLVDQGANFAVYSEHATRLELLLFDDPERELPTRQFA